MPIDCLFLPLQLHDKVVELKADNERLKITADQAEYLASVVQVGMIMKFKAN